MLQCEFHCTQCSEEMISLADGITYCENCGKVTSNFAPAMIPRMSAVIFRAKGLGMSKMTLRFAAPSEGEPAQLKIYDEGE